MAEEKKQDQNPKRGYSNSVLLLVMGIIVAMILIQNYLETKLARVSFSYQLEHLVNLDMLEPEESRKTASNNNLVTFAGKFRERETEEGKKPVSILAASR